jgi:hypothetical protein
LKADVISIQGYLNGFTAIKSDGSIVSWGQKEFPEKVESSHGLPNYVNCNNAACVATYPEK